METEERDKLILDNQGLIYDVIVKLKKKKPWIKYVISDEDLVSAGNVGFLKSLETYDKKQGKLTTYIYKGILYAIYKEIDKYQWPIKVPCASKYKVASESLKKEIEKASSFNKTEGININSHHEWKNNDQYVAVTYNQIHTKQEYEHLLFQLRYRKQELKFNGYKIDNRGLQKSSFERRNKRIERMIKHLEDYLER